MADGHLQIERGDDGIAILRMAKPPANAVDPEFLDGLHAALAELAADLPRALVFTGSGSFFSAGLDLKVMPTLDAAEQSAMLDRVNQLGQPLYAFPRPVVSAVNGHAVAAGFVLALAGDHRIAARGSNYGLTEVRAGMPYPVGALAAIQHELTPQAARRLVLGADLLDAERAVELGAFDEACESGEVLPRALEVAAQLAAHPAEAFERSKLALRAPMFAWVEERLRGGDPLAGAWILEESAEASRAVLGGDSAG